MRLKILLKRLLPERLFDLYHWLLAHWAARRFGYPSERLVVIGVTGTNGKSTVANLIARVLEGGGHKVGLASTVNFKVGEREWLNDTKMTMLGRSQLQRLLAEMVEAGCRYAVIETSSEGIKQFRHLGINYDLAVFTNLTPEHLESHGGFENYRQAKGRLFSKLGQDPVKTIAGQPIPKISLVNLASPFADFFLSFPGSRKWGFSAGPRPPVELEHEPERVVQAEEVELTARGSTFRVEGQPFSLRMIGGFNVENALAAIAVGLAYEVPLGKVAAALAAVKTVPGRMESIDAGQDFAALVDYAPEPESFRQLYRAIGLLERPKRIIHVLGSCGGGRDRDRRPVLGRLAAENADVVIVTNEDPYDDDPMAIINQVADGAAAAGKRDGEDLFRIEDRRAALAKAVELARTGDLVIATGKGAEQAICGPNGSKEPWDDRVRLREAIADRLAIDRAA